MTLEIALVCLILLGALVLFITEWIRMDLVALLVLVAVGITGLVTVPEALSGFSSPAVVTVWAMFIISGGLTVTGVAGILGQRVVKFAGDGEVRLIVTIMGTAGLLSAVMNNVGVAAMMLPVVVQIARRTGHSTSRLLMPLAMGSLLGGLTTLIGTPPNILVADAVRDYGLPPFRIFDFTPIGAVVLVVGIAFMALVGRRLLPDRDPLREVPEAGRDPRSIYGLEGRLFTLWIRPGSPLVGRSLEGSRLGSALRMNVVAVLRDGATVLAPTGRTILRGGDRLLAVGREDLVREVLTGSYFRDDPESAVHAPSMVSELRLWEASLEPDSPLVGEPLFGARLRERFDVRALAVRRGGGLWYRDIGEIRMEAGDLVLLHGSDEAIEALREDGLLGAIRGRELSELKRDYGFPGRLLSLAVPEDSMVAGRTLRESRLREVLGFDVWAVLRSGEIRVMPGPDDGLEAGDLLLLHGSEEDLATQRALGELRIEPYPARGLEALQSEEVGIAELVLAPESSVAGRTLRELDFRERYGVTVLGFLRDGEVRRSDLRDMELRFGDAFLVYGPREKLRILARDPDFVVLTEPLPAPPQREKAALAVAILAGVLLPVLLGWIPIALAAVTGATLMVLTRCLSMEEAYHFIEWKVVFLIAGMLPLGIAMDRTGAARLLADGVVAATGDFGPRAVLAGLFLLTSLATQVVPTAALVVLMAPIAFNAATDLGLSPLPFLMTIAIAASASLSSPVSHPANTLVMGPGGYRFVDYVRVGLPLTLLVFTIAMLMVPWLWPFEG